jgi:hypothetical protein
LEPDGSGGLEEFTFADRVAVIRGSWIEIGGVSAEVLARAESGL